MAGNLFVDKTPREEKVYARNEAHYKPPARHSGERRGRERRRHKETLAK